MYSIILNNGNTIDIKADKAEWYERDRTARFIRYNGDVVARINMDAVVGWVYTDDLKNFTPQYNDLEEGAIKTTGSCPKEEGE